MRLKLAAAAVVTASLAAGGAALASASAGGSSDDDAARTIKLFSLTVQTDNIDLGASGFSLGDQLVFSDDLSAREGSSKLGFDGGVCSIVRVADAARFSGTAQCAVTLSLAGGQITTQGLVTFEGEELPPPFDLAITGGTGAYKDARGEVTVEETSATEANLTVQLSGGSDD